MPNKPPEEPKWKRFEKIIAEIHRVLAPDADVKHDVRIVGKSGIERQLDVTVLGKIGPYPILIVIECKDENVPVEMGEVGEFADKLQDVEAEMGIMVSTSSFTTGAKKRAARQKNLLLQTYREAEEADWDYLIGPEAWSEMVWLEFSKITVFVQLPDKYDSGEIPLDTQIYSEAGVVIAILQDIQDGLLRELIQRLGHHAAPGIDVRIRHRLTESPIFVKRGEFFLQVHQIVIEVTIAAKKYLVNLQFAGGKILEDNKTDSLMYAELTGASLDLKSILNSQQGIEMSSQEYEQFINEGPDSILKLEPTKSPFQFVVTIRRTSMY